MCVNKNCSKEQTGEYLCGVYWIEFVWCILDWVCVVCIGLSLCGVYWIEFVWCILD